MIDTLPATSLTFFGAYRLATPSIRWTNPSLSVPGGLDAYCFALPVQGDSPTAYLAETKAFAGERYGGRGIKKNLGGVRCGTRAGVQVKGIGRNPLAGVTSAFAHSYGGATIREAVREAVWGEVCDFALPHGAVRTYGIIETGTVVPATHPGKQEITPRALIVREAALRPAHYMRSLEAAPSLDFSSSHVSDSERTRHAISTIREGLARSLCTRGGDVGGKSELKDLIAEMYRRFAAQVAAGFSKRIFHGALTESNICVDGRFIDFGTITTLPDFGRIITAQGMPNNREQASFLLAGAADLHFYVQKFLPEGDRKSFITPREIVAEYNKTFADEFFWRFLKLTGVPESVIRAANREACSQLFFVMSEIIDEGNTEPFQLRAAAPSKPAVMPEKMGNFHLNSILQIAGNCFDFGVLEEMLREQLPDPGLRHRFCRCYRVFREACSPPNHDCQTEGGRLFLRLNALRVNAPLRALQCVNFNQAIDRVVESEGDVARFISDSIQSVADLLVEPTEEGIYIWDNLKRIPISQHSVVPRASVRDTVVGYGEALGLSAPVLERLLKLCQ